MKQDERDELLIRLDTHIIDIRKDIKTVNRVLFGNGREGLAYIVARHKIYFGLIGGAIILLGGIIVNGIF